MEIMKNILRLFNISLFFYVLFFYILFILFYDFHILCINNLTTLITTLQDNKTLLHHHHNMVQYQTVFTFYVLCLEHHYT